jgi:hypothetical protein
MKTVQQVNEDLIALLFNYQGLHPDKSVKAEIKLLNDAKKPLRCTM